MSTQSWEAISSGSPPPDVDDELLLAVLLVDELLLVALVAPPTPDVVVVPLDVVVPPPPPVPPVVVAPLPARGAGAPSCDTVRSSAPVKFGVFDPLDGHRTRCQFDHAMLAQVGGCLGVRVEVTGLVRHDWRGRPMRVKVRELRPKPLPGGLPRFGPGEEIDITRGVESSDYVRRQRDAE